MILTITYRGENAKDFGYLLFKNPDRPQSIELSYGKGYIFYPKVDENQCMVALLLDIDPVILTRGKNGSQSYGLFDYVNDRPYVASSFLSSAIARAFGTAMSGRSNKRPDLAQSKLNLTATIVNLPYRGSSSKICEIFEPLGYSVDLVESILDENFSKWGKSKYLTVTISGDVVLKDMLNHLYVLIPAFDSQKHYWVGKDEIDKLIKHGDGWLENHPQKGFITQGFMGGRRSLANEAMKELTSKELEEEEDSLDGDFSEKFEEDDSDKVSKISLNEVRLNTVLNILKESRITSVIDLGCGEGKLLSLLMKEKKFTKLAGMDVVWNVLERAHRRLKLDRITEKQKERIQLFQSSLLYKDDRFRGYEAACVIEVIEHMDESRLDIFEKNIFGEIKPRIVIVTTPNAEYNKNYEGLKDESMRHSDHRFEWSRLEFLNWSKKVSELYGYSYSIKEIGDFDEETGTPTQLGVFRLCE